MLQSDLNTGPNGLDTSQTTNLKVFLCEPGQSQYGTRKKPQQIFLVRVRAFGAS